MNRRLFLMQAAAGVVLVACGAPKLDKASRAFICVNDVLGALSSMPSELAILGETYLREHPTENDGELLVNAVFDGTDDTGGGDLTESLRGTVKAEHAEGDVVEADGWRLARTEARLAALVYLSEQC